MTDSWRWALEFLLGFGGAMVAVVIAVAKVWREFGKMELRIDAAHSRLDELADKDERRDAKIERLDREVVRLDTRDEMRSETPPFGTPIAEPARPRSRFDPSKRYRVLENGELETEPPSSKKKEKP